MRPKTFLLLTTALASTACYTVTRTFDPHYSLESVAVRTDSGERAVPASGLGFVDGALAARFLLGRSQIEVDLENRTAYVVRVLWDDAAIVLPEGRSSPVMLARQTYISCWEPKRASTVPREARTITSFVPCVRLESGTGGWIERSLLPGLPARIEAYTRDTTISRQQREYRGATLGLLLPAEVDGIRRTYLLRFRLDSLPVRTDTSGNTGYEY